MDNLGRLVRERRTARGMGVRQLAGIVGKSGATVSFLESGKHRVGEETLERLLMALGVPPSERDRWYAAAGIIPHTIRSAMLARPGAWTRVREALSGPASEVAA